MPGFSRAANKSALRLPAGINSGVIYMIRFKPWSRFLPMPIRSRQSIRYWEPGSHYGQKPYNDTFISNTIFVIPGWYGNDNSRFRREQANYRALRGLPARL